MSIRRGWSVPASLRPVRSGSRRRASGRSRMAPTGQLAGSHRRDPRRRVPLVHPHPSLGKFLTGSPSEGQGENQFRLTSRRSKSSTALATRRSGHWPGTPASLLRRWSGTRPRATRPAGGSCRLSTGRSAELAAVLIREWREAGIDDLIRRYAAPAVPHRLADKGEATDGDLLRSSQVTGGHRSRPDLAGQSPVFRCRAGRAARTAAPAPPGAAVTRTGRAAGLRPRHRLLVAGDW